MATPATSTTFSQRAKDTFASLQFVWALGHLVTVISTIFYFTSFFDAPRASGHYTRAFLGAFVSYAVVVYKTFGVPEATPVFAQRFFSSENVQYLILTIIWIISPIYSVATIPFFVFSVFHLLNYVRVHLLPVLFPELKASTAAGSQAATPTGISHKISRALNSIIVNNNPIALYYVAYFEVVAVMGALIIGAFSLKSIFAPLFYAQFLRLRYNLSPHTRRAFSDLRTRLDASIIGQNRLPSKVPPVLVKAYKFLQNALISFGQAGVRTEQVPRK